MLPEPMRMLERAARETNKLVYVCAGVPGETCGVVYKVIPAEPEWAGVSHGACPSCAAKMWAALDADLAALGMVGRDYVHLARPRS